MATETHRKWTHGLQAPVYYFSTLEDRQAAASNGHLVLSLMTCA